VADAPTPSAYLAVQQFSILFHYAFGKPVERHEVTTAIGDFSKLSDDELLTQFEAAMASLRSERRVEGEKELLSFPAAPTAV
jgi:hypothetical protein